MRKKLLAVLCAASLAATLLGGCAGNKKYTEEEYQANFEAGKTAGYEEGYDAGYEQGIADDRSGQVQTMDYETFRALNAQNNLTCVIYVGRAECPFCSIVTDYMRSITDLPLPVFYVSLEPYYNSPYYEDFKAELGIEFLPTFIYYKDGQPTFYMNSPVTPGYFNESGQERVDAYNQMASKIAAFINGCLNDDPSVSEELERSEPVEEETSAENTSAEEAESAETAPVEESGAAEEAAAEETGEAADAE